jgi:hypothetical protein
MTKTKFQAKDLQRVSGIRECLRSFNIAAPEPLADKPSGWIKSKTDPKNILDFFAPELGLKEGFVLRAYRSLSRLGNEGRVYAMPKNSHFPEPSECMVDNVPRPPEALEDVMLAIEGDGTPQSYLLASVLAREMAGFGAVWHGVNWSEKQIIDCSPWCLEKKKFSDLAPTPKDEWAFNIAEPDDWAPHVLDLGEQGKKVVFYMYATLHGERVERNIDTYRDSSLVSQSRIEVVARGMIMELP